MPLTMLGWSCSPLFVPVFQFLLCLLLFFVSIYRVGVSSPP